MSEATLAQVALAPPLADITLNGAEQTSAFRLVNTSSVAEHVAVTVGSWDMDTHGTVHAIGPSEQSLAPWIEVNPTEFTVAPGQSQVVRYAIRPAVELTPGEHRAMIYFTEVHPAGDDPAPGTMRLNFNLAAAVYAHVGPINRSALVERIEPAGDGVDVTVRNTGNATTRMHGRYGLWHAGDAPTGAFMPVADIETGERAKPADHAPLVDGALPDAGVLPGAVRIFHVGLGTSSLTVGRYVLRLQGELAGTPFERELPLPVEPPGLLLAAKH